jgi:hypothetical protein
MEDEKDIDQTKEEKSMLVHGDPTKEFFITMLVKDITLKDAIGDLVDNAVDGIKVKAQNRDDLTNFSIDIKFDTSSFIIKDNGSGIEETVARNYAFKLGRPKDHKLSDNSIGRFGIGMKRAFFKLGDNITVSSIAPTSRFNLNILVAKWKGVKSWDFELNTVGINEINNDNQTYTEINITNLSSDAQDNFEKSEFEYDLKDEIAREQVLNINKGLAININGETLESKDLSFKYSDELIPSYWKHTFKDIMTGEELSVEIYAGISTEEEDDGGWNVFCNERLILDRDTTASTGWTGAAGDGVAKYHQQFWGFRGYVFFNAKNSTLLPWNTTKTGIDIESSTYVIVRKKMIEMMKDVFSLLNRQKKEREKDNPEKNQILNNKINAAVIVPLLSIIKDKSKLKAKFQYPKDLNPVRDKDNVIIKYSVPTVKYNQVKDKVDAINSADVGSKTFDYYYKHEIEY